MSMFKKFGFILGVFIAVVFAGYFGKLAYDNSSMERIFVERSKEINRQTPLMIDSDTRLEVTTAAGNTLIYKYTLVNFSSEGIDTAEFSRDLEELVTKNFCQQEDMVKFVMDGAECRYMYFDCEVDPILWTGQRLV